MNAELALERGAMVVSLPHLGTLQVTGSERRSWLQGVITCDVQDLRPHRGRHGLLLSRTGKIITDTTVLTTPDAFYLSVERSVRDSALAHLERLLVMEDAQVEERPDLDWLAVFGPHAAATVGAVEPTAELAAATVDYWGLVALVLVVPGAQAESLARSLVQAGGAAACRAEHRDWERLRIERNIPAFGVDYDERHTPHEASLEHRSVSFTKGCYVGQEVVARQEARGRSPRRLVWLRVGGSAAPPPGSEVRSLDGGQVVGQVTSSTLSPRAGPLAIARVQAAHSSPGARVRVGLVEATVGQDQAASPVRRPGPAC